MSLTPTHRDASVTFFGQGLIITATLGAVRRRLKPGAGRCTRG